MDKHNAHSRQPLLTWRDGGGGGACGRAGYSLVPLGEMVNGVDCRPAGTAILPAVHRPCCMHCKWSSAIDLT